MSDIKHTLIKYNNYTYIGQVLCISNKNIRNGSGIIYNSDVYNNFDDFFTSFSLNKLKYIKSIEGKWKNDKLLPHKNIIIKFADGDSMELYNTINNKSDGYYKYNDGNVYAGVFINGKPIDNEISILETINSKVDISYLMNDIKYEGQIEDNKWTGEYILTNTNINKNIICELYPNAHIYNKIKSIKMNYIDGKINMSLPITIIYENLDELEILRINDITAIGSYTFFNLITGTFDIMYYGEFMYGVPQGLGRINYLNSSDVKAIDCIIKNNIITATAYYYDENNIIELETNISKILTYDNLLELIQHDTIKGTKKCGKKVYKDESLNFICSNITYTGEFKNGEPNGIGLIKYDNEKYSAIECEIYGSSINILKIYYKNGNILYKITPHENIIFGEIKYANGDIYDGIINMEEPHGKGTYKYNNGDIYIGMFQDGKKQGLGTYKTKNYKCNATWYNDKLNGTVKYIYNNGNEIFGTIRDGKKQGRILYYDDILKIQIELLWCNNICASHGYIHGTNKKKIYLNNILEFIIFDDVMALLNIDNLNNLNYCVILDKYNNRIECTINNYKIINKKFDLVHKNRRIDEIIESRTINELFKMYIGLKI